MGNRLTHGLGWRGHWLDMLGGSAGKVNEAIGLSAPHEDCWRKIAIGLVDRGQSILDEWPDCNSWESSIRGNSGRFFRIGSQHRPFSATASSRDFIK
jgi:hypothetical protein